MMPNIHPAVAGEGVIKENPCCRWQVQSQTSYFDVDTDPIRCSTSGHAPKNKGLVCMNAFFNNVVNCQVMLKCSYLFAFIGNKYVSDKGDHQSLSLSVKQT